DRIIGAIGHTIGHVTLLDPVAVDDADAAAAYRLAVAVVDHPHRHQLRVEGERAAAAIAGGDHQDGIVIRRPSVSGPSCMPTAPQTRSPAWICSGVSSTWVISARCRPQNTCNAWRALCGWPPPVVLSQAASASTRNIALACFIFAFLSL